MITIDAARALGMQDEIGSLEAGKRADVTIIDARQPHLAPEILAPLRVIGHASGQDVTDVIVDGEVLMRDRIVAGADQDAILDDAHQALLATWERTGFGDIEAQHPDTGTASATAGSPGTSHRPGRARRGGAIPASHFAPPS